MTAMMILGMGTIVRKPREFASFGFRILHANALRPTPGPLFGTISTRRRSGFAAIIEPKRSRQEESIALAISNTNHHPWTDRQRLWQSRYRHSQRTSVLRPLSSSSIPEISSGSSGSGEDDDDDNDLGFVGFDYDPQLEHDGSAFGDHYDDRDDEDAAAADAALSARLQQLLLRDLNPSQVEAVTQPLRLPHPTSGELRSVVTRVIAGPGSGKTKVLTTRIAHLLREDPYGRILAVTFTRKAAGEMKERLERLLREQHQEKTSTMGGGGRSSSGDEEEFVAVAQTADGRADAEGAVALDGIERVELGTFHSICAKILRYNGEMLRDLPSVRRDMSKAQPVWVERIPPVDENSDNDNDNGTPEKILVDPEIRLNGQYVIIDQGEQIRILNECLKEQHIDLKHTEVKPIQIITTIGKIKEAFAKGQNPFANTPGRPPGRTMIMTRKVYFRYREKLLANNALDFDDLILLTRELLMEDEELRHRLHRRWPHVLVDEYQDTSRVQMDLIKLLTSSSLFVVGDADQSIYSWRGAHVGSLEDVKTEFEPYGTVQTVFLKENYRSTSNIVRAAEKVISSGQYQKQPISVVAEVLAEEEVHKEDDKHKNNASATERDDLRRAMKPKRGAGPSPRVVACEDERSEARFVVDTILELKASNDLAPGDTVAMVYRTNAQSRYLEEACVQQNLPYVIRGGAGGFYKRAEIKDCLCFLRWLYNGNDEGSMIRAMKTPSKGIGAKGFGEFRDYCDLVQSYIRQNHPDCERPTYLDVLISMTNRGGDSDKDYLLPEGTPSAEDHISKRALNNFLKFSAQMGEIRANAYRADVGTLLLFVIEKLKLLDHFDAISKSKSEFLERKENVKELRNAANKYASYGPSLTRGPSDNDNGDVMGVDSALSSFLDDVALVSDTAEANEEDKDPSRMVVNLMTIHASKGTEFDCVFVVGLEEGTLPCSPAIQEGPGSVQLEEEKRLCYVAMTRAKTRLVLTWRKELTSFSKWNTEGPKTNSKQRSRFLNAIVSKKSRAKDAKRNPKGAQSKTRMALRNASRSTSRSGSAAGRSPAVGSSSSRYVNRTGLKGADARRSPQAARRAMSSSSSSSSRRMEPPIRPRNRTTSSSASRPKSSRPSVERVEALRSTLSSPSSAGAGVPPKRRNPPPRSAPPKQVHGKAQPSARRGSSFNNNASSSSSSSSSSRPPPRSSSRSPPNDIGVDPTWFFPVGVRVVHMNLGKGTVVEPPPFRTIEDAKVRVRFENGKTLEFPALGSDIVPDMGGF